jgi:uroporphyrinogen decarboxylase
VITRTKDIPAPGSGQRIGRRKIIRTIIGREKPARTGFWLGNPHPATWPLLHKHFGTRSEEELRIRLEDDVRWICPQFYADAYRDPGGRSLFDSGLDREKHGNVGPLACCDSPADVEEFPWPRPEYLNFDSCLRDLRNAGDVYRLSGFWTCYYHNIADLFGMEEYFVKMQSCPDVVRAVTDRVCEFYYEANERFFAAAGSLVDGFFFGNDFGSQTGTMCSPAALDTFVFPWLRRFVEQGHRHGYQVVLHSCGSVYRLIERFIVAGVDCLHPLQALARDMEAQKLAGEFKGRIAFMGGIDTQNLLTNGTPDQVRADVRRVRNLLGPHLIVSPSHEALLPNIPMENVAALAEAVHDDE